MDDIRRPAPDPGLWVVPSEDLSPGAVTFLEMVGALRAGDDLDGAMGLRPRPILPAAADGDQGDGPLPAAPVPGPAGRPVLRLVASGDHGIAEDGEDAERGAPGASAFLEMAERAATVRGLDDGDAVETGSLAGWLPEDRDGAAPPADDLGGVVEQMMWHLNRSDIIRNEEVRSALLSLFGDFAVRRPWAQQERPEAQRVQRLAERPREEGSGPTR